MFNFFLYKIQLLRIRLRRFSLSYWWSRYIKDLTFFTMVGLPIVTVGYIFHFAYEDHLQVIAENLRHADLTCLAQNIYYEARGESVTGQKAVAEVTMNRVKSKRFPDDVCAVVHEKRWDSIRKRYVGAFSWTELRSLKRPKGVSWERATEIAMAAYDNQESDTVPGALYYHADRINPRWSRTKKLIATIGSHKFYE
jgi:N-acetylmuramoyl-L-alanine amidase